MYPDHPTRYGNMSIYWASCQKDFTLLYNILYLCMTYYITKDYRVFECGVLNCLFWLFIGTWECNLRQSAQKIRGPNWIFNELKSDFMWAGSVMHCMLKNLGSGDIPDALYLHICCHPPWYFTGSHIWLTQSVACRPIWSPEPGTVTHAQSWRMCPCFWRSLSYQLCMGLSKSLWADRTGWRFIIQD